jgi:hypothetical protein
VLFLAGVFEIVLLTDEADEAQHTMTYLVQLWSQYADTAGVIKHVGLVLLCSQYADTAGVIKHVGSGTAVAADSCC